MREYGAFTGIMMNLLGNNSVALLQILPRDGNSEISAIIDRRNYPINIFRLQKYDFLRLTLSREIHSRQSTEGSPCSKEDETIFYEVRLDDQIWLIISALSLFLAVH